MFIGFTTIFDELWKRLWQSLTELKFHDVDHITQLLGDAPDATSVCTKALADFNGLHGAFMKRSQEYVDETVARYTWLQKLLAGKNGPLAAPSPRTCRAF